MEKVLQSVFPDLAERWLKVAEDLWVKHEIRLLATEGLRDFSRQWEIYSQGRVKNEQGQWVISDPTKIISHATPLQSLHSYGLAIDSCFSGSDPFLEKYPPGQAKAIWDEYGRFVRIHGMQWGGNFKDFVDRPHCQMTYGLSIHEIQMLYEKDGIKGVWEKCKTILNCGGEFK